MDIMIYITIYSQGFFKGILILNMGIYILFMSHVAKTMWYNH